MSERSAHDPVHDAATPREAILVGGAEVRDLVELFTGELMSREAAAQAGVDRSTIMTLRKTAQDGAIAALQASWPGRPRDAREAGEVARVKAENTRLSATIVDGSVS
jgi:hypothetical protein